MKRTAAREREIRALAETVDQRALARSVSCDDCRAHIDRPCVSRHGGELRAEHPRRIRKAQRMAAAGELACTYCRRLELDRDAREGEPYPEVIETCERHRQLCDELAEALKEDGGT